MKLVHQGQNLFNRVDPALTRWMARYGITLIRTSLGIVFLWFGVLKFFPGLSPAEQLAGRTIAKLTWGAIQPSHSLLILAIWESLIGLGLHTGKAMRATLFLLFLQMPGTILPLFFFPGETFLKFPFAPTLEGINALDAAFCADGFGQRQCGIAVDIIKWTLVEGYRP